MRDELGPKNPFRTNGSPNKTRDFEDTSYLKCQHEQSRSAVGAKEQKVNRASKESESEEEDRTEEYRDKVSNFWAGLASEEELSQLRKKGKQQRKVRKSKGDRRRKEKKKEKVAATEAGKWNEKQLKKEATKWRVELKVHKEGTPSQ
ncbi:hypothetical protein SLA2020_218970 [Shorea laevis]